MDCRFSSLRHRDVINISTGNRMGRVCDALIDLRSGQITALIVPGPCRWGWFGREDDYILPWSNIVRVGTDIVLVEVKGEFLRRKRQTHFF